MSSYHKLKGQFTQNTFFKEKTRAVGWGKKRKVSKHFFKSWTSFNLNAVFVARCVMH